MTEWTNGPMGERMDGQKKHDLWVQVNYRSISAVRKIVRPKKEKKIQLNPALTDPPPTEFRLKQMQIHGPFKSISFISVVGYNRSPPIREQNCYSLEIR